MKKAFAILIFAVLFSSCVHIESAWTSLTNRSETDDEADRVVNAITPEQEYVIGRAVAANILTRYRIVTNRPALTSYLNLIAQALIVNSSSPETFHGYRVAILDSDEINAFATPGGHIFLTRGLIDVATSEDTLAAVIAHEIAHVQLRHGIRAIRNDRFAQVILDGITSFADMVSPNAELARTLNDSVNEIMGTMVTNGFSQVQEFAADSEAQRILVAAGYSPFALIEMLHILEEVQPSRPGGFNTTHPTPALRISNIQRAALSHRRVADTRSYREDRFSAIR